VFLSVLKTTVKHVSKRNPDWAAQSPKKRKPILVLVDGHSSHHSAAILKYCMKQNIKMITSPAHCTHVVQILDSHQLLGAFQTKLRGYIQEASDAGRPVNVETFGTALMQAKEDVFDDSRRIRRAFRDYGIFPFDFKRLCTNKLKQHAAVQQIEEYKRCRRKGMSDAKARTAARNKMTTPPIQYEEQWKRDIVDYFVQQVDQPIDVSDDNGKTQMVCDAIVDTQAKVFSQNFTKESAAEIIVRKRQGKALSGQAEVLTTDGHLDEAVQREKELKVGEDLNNRKRQYKAQRKLQKQAIEQENENNRAPLQEVKKSLKRVRQELKEVQAVAKKARRTTTTSSTSTQVR
jgi:hypothetical protein